MQGGLFKVRTTVHAQCEYTLKGVPTVVAHRDFLHVGCLLITNEAIERLYQIVQKRKQVSDDLHIQKGNYEP